MDHRLISRFVAYFVQGFLRNAGSEQQLISRLAFFSVLPSLRYSSCVLSSLSTCPRAVCR